MLKALRRNQPIRLDDYEFLRDNVPDYQAISAIAQMQPSPEARYKGLSIEEVSVIGVTPSHVDIGREKVVEGRYITEQDYDHNSHVCFIGQDVVNKFFPGIDPLGQEINVAGQQFRVIGVADTVGTTFGISQDNFVMIPLTAFRNSFM